MQIVHLEDGNAHCNTKKMYYYDRHYTGHEEPERPTRRGTKRYRDKDAPKRALYVKSEIFDNRILFQRHTINFICMLQQSLDAFSKNIQMRIFRSIQIIDC